MLPSSPSWWWPTESLWGILTAGGKWQSETRFTSRPPNNPLHRGCCPGSYFTSGGISPRRVATFVSHIPPVISLISNNIHLQYARIPLDIFMSASPKICHLPSPSNSSIVWSGWQEMTHRYLPPGIGDSNPAIQTQILHFSSHGRDALTKNTQKISFSTLDSRICETSWASDSL